MLKSLCDILNDAFREVRGRSPKRFLEAVDAYAGAVAPAAGLTGVGLATFADWFLFDYAPGDGATPLPEYAHGLPAGPARDDAVTVAETGLFASFVYVALEAEGDATVAALADISTGRAYAVEGSQLTDCPEWAGSVVTGRIARTADGSWHAVSPFFYRDRAPLEVGLRVAAGIRDSRPAGTPLSVAFAAEMLGGGPLTDSLRVSGAPGL
ncbi:hypothetical protein [Enorma phocaeensis]|uniref:DUF2612 domain-containing protein n=1 Tax=Enorma phocaeensis TaxID=1871019 RepID=A0ABT7V9I5_9ACTN|nr:hypothetical protein [Enorma phocaeensis]MDM8275166.1 hypothetical protein [Enorma phocaeensis]